MVGCWLYTRPPASHLAPTSQAAGSAALVSVAPPPANVADEAMQVPERVALSLPRRPQLYVEPEAATPHAPPADATGAPRVGGPRTRTERPAHSTLRAYGACASCFVRRSWWSAAAHKPSQPHQSQLDGFSWHIHCKHARPPAALRCSCAAPAPVLRVSACSLAQQVLRHSYAAPAPLLRRSYARPPAALFSRSFAAPTLLLRCSSSSPALLLRSSCAPPDTPNLLVCPEGAVWQCDQCHRSSTGCFLELL